MLVGLLEVLVLVLGGWVVCFVVLYGEWLVVGCLCDCYFGYVGIFGKVIGFCKEVDGCYVGGYVFDYFVR